MHVNWHEVQKLVEAAVIFTWEHWLSKQTLFEAGSTVGLVIDGFKKLFSKGQKK